MQQYLSYTCTDINETGPSLVVFLRVDQFYVLRFLFCRVYLEDEVNTNIKLSSFKSCNNSKCLNNIGLIIIRKRRNEISFIAK